MRALKITHNIPPQQRLHNNPLRWPIKQQRRLRRFKKEAILRALREVRWKRLHAIKDIAIEHEWKGGMYRMQIRYSEGDMEYKDDIYGSSDRNTLQS